jgi:hypothetical protein
MSDGHRLIWDVNRLIELSRNLPIVDVPLSKVKELEETYWFDSDGPAPTCRAVIAHAKLISATDLQYPIIISPDGRVMDGIDADT